MVLPLRQRVLDVRSVSQGSIGILSKEMIFSVWVPRYLCQAEDKCRNTMVDMQKPRAGTESYAWPHA